MVPSIDCLNVCSSHTPHNGAPGPLIRACAPTRLLGNTALAPVGSMPMVLTPSSASLLVGWSIGRARRSSALAVSHCRVMRRVWHVQAPRGRRLTFIQEPTNARRSNHTQHYNKDHVSEAAACLSERESPLHSRCKPLQSLSQGAQTTRLSCASHMPTYSPTISPPNSQAWCRSASAHHARECNRASDRDLVISPCQLLCRKRSSTTRNAH